MMHQADSHDSPSPRRRALRFTLVALLVLVAALIVAPLIAYAIFPRLAEQHADSRTSQASRDVAFARKLVLANASGTRSHLVSENV